jgi:hypothetical protein
MISVERVGVNYGIATFPLNTQALLDIKNNNTIHVAMISEYDYYDNAPTDGSGIDQLAYYEKDTDIILDYNEFTNDIYPLGITQYKNVNGVLMADIGGII